MYYLISNAKCFYPHWNSKGIQNHGNVHELKRKKKADNKEKHKEKTLARKQGFNEDPPRLKMEEKQNEAACRVDFQVWRSPAQEEDPGLSMGLDPSSTGCDGKENLDALNTALLCSDLFIRFMQPNEHFLEKVTVLKNFAKPSCHGL